LLLPVCLCASLGAAGPSTRPAVAPVRLKVELPGHRRRDLEQEIASYDATLRGDAKDASAYQRRGAARFRLGHVTEAVADFDKFLELRPEQKPHHWQRGIALYYAGRFDDAAKQFELHRSVNPQDVENATWHYLCVTRAAAAGGADLKDAVTKARKTLIPIREDRRVPMMNVYALYGGKGTPQDVLAAAKVGAPGEEELKERLFYAHLYLGLWHEAAGETEEARKHIKLAAGEFAQDHYMGDVARVHAAALAKEGAKGR
jgi:lipoprotein NlpI